jgi:hypothetical protein
MPCYVITAPESAQGIFETWDECQAAKKGVKGVKHHRGGVGVVVAWMGDDPKREPVVVTEIGTSVGHAFYDGLIPASGA